MKKFKELKSKNGHVPNFSNSHKKIELTPFTFSGSSDKSNWLDVFAVTESLK